MFAGMEALEDLKDAVEVLRGDADAIVADRKDPAVFLLESADVDFRRAFAMEFEGVADEILEELGHLGGIGSEDREGVARDRSFGCFDAGLEIVEGVSQYGVQVCGCERGASGAY